MINAQDCKSGAGNILKKGDAFVWNSVCHTDLQIMWVMLGLVKHGLGFVSIFAALCPFVSARP